MLHGHLIALALAAAAPWAEPVSLGTPALEVGSPAIAFARDGTALLSTNANSRPGGAFTGRLVIRAPNGAVTESRLPDQLAADPVVYGRGQVALLRFRRASRPGGRTRLSVSFGTTTAPASGRPRMLSALAPDRSGSVGGPAIAVSAQGEVAVAWVEFQQRGRIQGLGIHRLRLAIRPPGRAFGRPRTLATANEDLHSVVLAYGGTGDLVAAYGAERIRGRTRRTVEARLRRSRGAFGPTRVLGPQEGVLDLSAAMARTGRAVVAWGTQDGGEEAGLPYRVRAAIRAPGSATFGRPQLLDRGGSVVERPVGGLALGLAPDGSATVTWSNIVGNTFYPVRVATAGPSTRFRPAGQLAPNGAASDVAVRGDGTTLVVWTAFNELDTDSQVQTALRPTGSLAFGSVENVTAVESTQLSAGGAAFDPATDRAAVVWARLAEPGPTAPLWFSSRTP